MNYYYNAERNRLIKNVLDEEINASQAETFLREYVSQEKINPKEKQIIDFKPFELLSFLKGFNEYKHIPSGVIAWILKACFSRGYFAETNEKIIWVDNGNGYTDTGVTNSFTPCEVNLMNYLNYSPECDEWIVRLKKEYAKANTTVLRFIYTFANDDMYRFFSVGNCYYFACMLYELTKRGTVCWHRNYNHIVWKDIDGCAYDVYGFFNDYDLKNDLVPIHVLGSRINDFKHFPNYVYSAPLEFREWSKNIGATDAEAMDLIYNMIPEYDDTKSQEEQVLLFWPTHKQESKNKITEWIKQKW